MVEVDVGEEEVSDVRERAPRPRRPLSSLSTHEDGTAVEEREAVICLQKVGADDALRALVVEVDRIRAHASPNPSREQPLRHRTE